MKSVSTTTLAFLLMLPNLSFAADHGSSETQAHPHGQGQVVSGQHQDASVQQGQEQGGNEAAQQEASAAQQEASAAQQEASAAQQQANASQQSQGTVVAVGDELQATQAEIRSLQAIHLSNLTQFAVQLLGVSRLTDDAAKKEALDSLKASSQSEIELARLAKRFGIDLKSTDADIVAIKDKNQEMLNSLVQAPEADFASLYDSTLQTHKNELLQFLQKESESAFNHTEIQDYVKTVIANLEQGTSSEEESSATVN